MDLACRDEQGIGEFLCIFLDHVDYGAMTDFFLTYRSYIDSEALLEMLCERYSSVGDGAVETQRLRVRVFVAMRHWILNYYADDFLGSVSLQQSMGRFLDSLGGIGADEISTEARISKELRKSWNRERALREQVRPIDSSECTMNAVHRDGCRDRASANSLVSDRDHDSTSQQTDRLGLRHAIHRAEKRKNLKRGNHRLRSFLSVLDYEVAGDLCVPDSRDDSSDTRADAVSTRALTENATDEEDTFSLPESNTGSLMENFEQAFECLGQLQSASCSRVVMESTEAQPVLGRTLRRKPGRNLKRTDLSHTRRSSRSSASTVFSHEPWQQYIPEDGFDIRRHSMVSRPDDMKRLTSRHPGDNAELLQRLRDMLYGELEDATEEADSKSIAVRHTRAKLEGNGSGRKRRSSSCDISLISPESSPIKQLHGSIQGSEKRRKHVGVTRLPDRFALPPTLNLYSSDNDIDQDAAPMRPRSEQTASQDSLKSSPRQSAEVQKQSKGGSDMNEESCSISIIEALSIPSCPRVSQGFAERRAFHLSPTWILACNTASLAQALTAIEKSVFLEFDWLELTSGRWITSINTALPMRNWQFVVSQETTGLGLITARFNCVVSWLSTQLIRVETTHDRVEILSKFIDVAALCKNYGNYTSMMQIVTSLKSPAIRALSKTWKRLPDDTRRTWRSLQCLGDDHTNWHLLKGIQERALLDPAAIVVPFLGSYLSELLIVDQSDLETIPRMFSMARTTKTLLEMLDRITIDKEMDRELVDKLVWIQGLDDATLLGLAETRESKA